MRRSLRVVLFASLVVVPLLSLSPTRARAQAWVPTELSLQLSVDYAFVFSTSDVFSEPVPPVVEADGTEDSRFRHVANLNTHLFVPTVDFTPVANLGLKIWVPMALSGCVDDQPTSCPHNHPSDQENVDDGKKRFTIQDLNFEARYMFDFPDVITVAPALGFSFPLTDYPTVGHAIVGRGRPQIRFGLNAGRALTDLIPGMYLHGRYQFAYVIPLSEDAYANDPNVPHMPNDSEELKKVSIHRSMIDVEIGYFFFEDLSARITAHWEITHGGVEYVDTLDDAFGILNRNHDVLGAERYFLAGIGVSYILLDEVFLSATFLKWIDGSNTHNSDSINFSVAYTIF